MLRNLHKATGLSFNSKDDHINSTIKPIDREDSNAELEKNEIVLNLNNLQVHKVLGKRHHSGGTPVNLDDNSFIFSDYKKLNISPKSGEELDIIFKNKKTPAKLVSSIIDIKKHNKNVANLDDEKADDITKVSSSIMIKKNMYKLGGIAHLQESKKGFPNGNPEFSKGEPFNQNLKTRIDSIDQYQGGGNFNNIMSAQDTYDFIYNPVQLRKPLRPLRPIEFNSPYSMYGNRLTGDFKYDKNGNPGNGYYLNPMERTDYWNNPDYGVVPTYNKLKGFNLGDQGYASDILSYQQSSYDNDTDAVTDMLKRQGIPLNPENLKNGNTYADGRNGHRFANVINVDDSYDLSEFDIVERDDQFKGWNPLYRSRKDPFSYVRLNNNLGNIQHPDITRNDAPNPPTQNKTPLNSYSFNSSSSNSSSSNSSSSNSSSYNSTSPNPSGSGISNKMSLFPNKYNKGVGLHPMEMLSVGMPLFQAINTRTQYPLRQQMYSQIPKLDTLTEDQDISNVLRGYNTGVRATNMTNNIANNSNMYGQTLDAMAQIQSKYNNANVEIGNNQNQMAAQTQNGDMVNNLNFNRDYYDKVNLTKLNTQLYRDNGYNNAFDNLSQVGKANQTFNNILNSQRQVPLKDGTSGPLFVPVKTAFGYDMQLNPMRNLSYDDELLAMKGYSDVENPIARRYRALGDANPDDRLKWYEAAAKLDISQNVGNRRAAPRQKLGGIFKTKKRK